MLPGAIDCTMYNMHMDYDGEKYVDFGVNVTTTGYGDPFCKGCVSTPGMESVFVQYTDHLVKRFGYPNGTTLFSTIPFDFRLGPEAWTDTAKEPTGGYFFETGQFKRLRNLIEARVEEYNRKCILGSISEGGTFVQIFLENVSAEWKKKYLLGGHLSQPVCWLPSK